MAGWFIIKANSLEPVYLYDFELFYRNPELLTKSNAQFASSLG